jgi:hypothetical protein
MTKVAFLMMGCVDGTLAPNKCQNIRKTYTLPLMSSIQHGRQFVSSIGAADVFIDSISETTLDNASLPLSAYNSAACDITFFYVLSPDAVGIPSVFKNTPSRTEFNYYGILGAMGFTDLDSFDIDAISGFIQKGARIENIAGDKPDLKGEVKTDFVVAKNGEHKTLICRDIMPPTPPPSPVPTPVNILQNNSWEFLQPQCVDRWDWACYGSGSGNAQEGASGAILLGIGLGVAVGVLVITSIFAVLMHRRDMSELTATHQQVAETARLKVSTPTPDISRSSNPPFQKK